jgi:SagB-type dehydrogenase family enzyme
VSTPAPTEEFASFVYGDEVALDDPGEAYHEASRLYPDVVPGRLAMFTELSDDPELQQTVVRSSRTHDHRPGIDLPPARVARTWLHEVVLRRRSSSKAYDRPLSSVQLAALLATAYRSANGRRPVPSAGALYPLELYVVALDIADVEPAAYHYNPFRHCLERLRPAVRDDVAAALVDPTLAEHTAALIIVTAMFWRSRFKYGVRGYRFALLEAGHLMQNAVLAAAAMKLPALPIGGFYDCRLDALVCANGLDEATVYALIVGGEA